MIPRRKADNITMNNQPRREPATVRKHLERSLRWRNEYRKDDRRGGELTDCSTKCWRGGGGSGGDGPGGNEDSGHARTRGAVWPERRRALAQFQIERHHTGAHARRRRYGRRGEELSRTQSCERALSQWILGNPICRAGRPVTRAAHPRARYGLGPVCVLASSSFFVFVFFPFFFLFLIF
jgi:hypothetical protein